MISEIEHTELLVIGAGPYGLATAAHAIGGWVRIRLLMNSPELLYFLRS